MLYLNNKKLLKKYSIPKLDLSHYYKRKPPSIARTFTHRDEYDDNPHYIFFCTENHSFSKNVAISIAREMHSPQSHSAVTLIVSLSTAYKCVNSAFGSAFQRQKKLNCDNKKLHFCSPKVTHLVIFSHWKGVASEHPLEGASDTTLFINFMLAPSTRK